MDHLPRGWRHDFPHVLQGLLMGAADIVPGVSGGTVALLLGIYARLLQAISHVDRRLFQLLATRRWRAAAQHLDLRFLVALVVGIVVGVLSLAGVLHFLLSFYHRQTMAAFFGLILASGVLVARMVRPQKIGQLLLTGGLGLLAAAAAAQLVLGAYLEPRPGLGYVFLCGMIAICAMILPGISGAYLLVLLGKYEEITGILHRLKGGEMSGNDLATLVVFTAGCLMGLLLFSKVLKALLTRFERPTMAVLAGFMIGSLVKVWPFQRPLQSAEEVTKHRLTQPVWPSPIDGEAITCLLIATTAFLLVIVVDAMAQQRRVG